MPNIETQEQHDKAIVALKEYYKARDVATRAQTAANDKLGALKSITGIVTNDALKLEEEVVMMLGRIAVNGLPETR